jgi:short-subunit dehydrogenase
MSLKDKTVFITGGTGGIGVPLVELLRARGAIVAVYDRARLGNLNETVDSTCNMLRGTTPDILINMAGINDFNRAEDQDYGLLLTLNLLVPMRLSQAVLPAMRWRGSGQIVNIGSMTGFIPLPHFSGYVAAKAGLKGFSDALRREVSQDGITITHIAPRAVKTAMNTGHAGLLNQRTKTREDAPDKIAHRIVRAIERRETDVRIGWPERAFAILNAVFPALIDKGLQNNRMTGEEILAENRDVASPTLSLSNIPSNHVDERKQA